MGADRSALSEKLLIVGSVALSLLGIAVPSLCSRPPAHGALHPRGVSTTTALDPDAGVLGRHSKNRDHAATQALRMGGIAVTLVAMAEFGPFSLVRREGNP